MEKPKVYTDPRIVEIERLTPINVTESERVFIDLLKKCSSIYSLKNERYGNSFDKSIDEDGLLVAKIRLNDKLMRFSQLIKNPNMHVLDESMEDTLIDMANYALMTASYIKRNNLNQ